jgi:hypothetical protein
MSLMDHALDIKARLLALQQWSQRKYDAQALDTRKREWTDQLLELKKVVNQLDWMDVRQPGLAECKEQVGLARHLICQSQQVLSDGGGNDELTHAKEWEKTIKATEKAVTMLREFAKVTWKKSIDNFGSFRSRSAIEITLPLSRPGNRETIEEYATVYGNYQRMARQDGPLTCDDFIRVEQLALQLREIAERFNFAEVPEAVAKFFAAIDSGQGAPLSLLTNEVRDWLTAEGQSDSFIVLSRQ